MTTDLSPDDPRPPADRPTAPTNGRLWPGQTVTVTWEGQPCLGVVDLYEWWWSGVTFPVKFCHRQVVIHAMFLPGDVQTVPATQPLALEV